MRYLSVLLVVAIMCSACLMQGITVFATGEKEEISSQEDAALEVNETEDKAASVPEIDYKEYSESNATIKKATSNVKINVEEFEAKGASCKPQKNSVVWNKGLGSLTWKVTVPKTAKYNIKIGFETLETGVNLMLGVMIDGKYPFADAETIELSKKWMNKKDEYRIDAQGNEYAQEQVEAEGVVETLLTDETGVAIDPYEFVLTEGEHTITIVEPEQSIKLYSLACTAPEVVSSYKEVSASYKVEAVDAAPIVIQGEDATIKSSSAIIPKANNSDAGMNPCDPYKTKINYIGGTSWQTPGSKIVWEFDVEKSGYYYFNMRYKQSDLVNGESWRWLKIDGKTPFAEAKSLRFNYDTEWKHYTFGANEDEPYYIWLEKGKHTLSMEATLGNQSEYFYRLSKIVDMLGDEYIKIVMITSESPDVNRDYELFKQIPGFTEVLKECNASLLQLAADIKEQTGNDSSQAVASMENMARVLNNMLRSPYFAQQYVKDYYTNYTSLSSWLYDMTDMPLSVDEIQFVPVGSEYNGSDAGFFKSFGYRFLRLVSSFTNDYSLTNAEAKKDDNTIRLWVNWGQDQVAVLNSMIEDSFTAETGIKVQLEIVSASLINGILANNFPDVALHLSRTEPVNMGIRGALSDLTEFDDYKQVLERFQDSAADPYFYNDALYALPDTQSFMLMFYRNDILEQLELDVPQTWDEFFYASTIIQRNNMDVYVPYTQIVASTTVNAGIGNLNLFPTLMSQHGLSLYNEEMNATKLNYKPAISVFEEWTEFYTDYGFQKEADFYNRLRVGVMPLGIAPYATYMTLYSAAPEIQGRWSIALIPGTKEKDGTINRTVAGSGSGCSIVKKSNKQKQAWEFLKWWTSAETQARYTSNVESILGMIGRTATATVDAFSSLAWDKGDLEILLEQWSYVDEIEEVPGSYYLTRSIDQAFWSVVNGQSNAKDAIVKWSLVADNEIDRKIKEYF